MRPEMCDFARAPVVCVRVCMCACVRACVRACVPGQSAGLERDALQRRADAAEADARGAADRLHQVRGETSI